MPLFPMTNIKNSLLELNTLLEEIAKFTSSKRAHDFVCRNLLLSSKSAVETEMDTVCEMIQFLQGEFNGLFSDNYDLLALLDKLSKGYTLSSYEVLLINQEIRLAHSLKNKFKSFSDKQKLLNLSILFNSLFSLKELRDKIENVVSNTGEIKDSATPTYQNLIRKKEEHLLLGQKLEKRIIKEYEKVTIDRIIHLQEGRKTILVDISQKGQISGNVIGISSSGKACFIEPKELTQWNSELVIINDCITKEAQKILKLITKQITKELPVLNNNQEIYLRLDILFAKAKYAALGDMVKVNISDKLEIILYSAMQPLISKRLCVPIDFSFRSDKDIYLITGANAGGKTVAMKTVYLLIEMAKRGLLLPCKANSTLYLFDNIYFNIGDNQSLTDSLSTFQSHITSINHILLSATNHDLVMLDELGSGTSPTEGQALAISILNYLHHKQIKTIVSTHFPEVKLFASNTNFITYASVLFDPVTLKPSYKLVENEIGQSFGIALSEKFGLIPTVINDARKILVLMQSENEKKYQELETKINEVSKLKEMVLAEKEKLETQKKELETSYKLKIAALDEEYYLKFNELQTQIKKLKSNFQGASPKNNFTRTENKPTPKDFQVGEMVYVLPYNLHAPIQRIEKNNYFININGLSLNFTIDELTYSDKKRETKKEYYHPREASTKVNRNDFTTKLDLRGKRYIEVADLIAQKIDECLYNGVTSFIIITGYGKGDVRKASIDYLKNSKYVKDYSFGGEGAGLMGALKINLK